MTKRALEQDEHQTETPEELVVSDEVYLQPYEAGESHRFLVHRSSFAALSKDSWFHRHLVAHVERPMIEDAGDGLPVYFADAPHAALLELIECARNPARRQRVQKEVPVSLRGMYDLPTWREMLERFNLEELEPPAKVQKVVSPHELPGWFPTAPYVRASPGDFFTAKKDGGTGAIVTCYHDIERVRPKHTTTITNIYSDCAEWLIPLLVVAGYKVTRENEQPFMPVQISYLIDWS
jgi:hypothetical protein